MNSEGARRLKTDLCRRRQAFEASGSIKEDVRITVRAPAKINLDLQVLRCRRDGFHELRSVMQSVALHDTLSIRRRPGPLTVHSRTAEVPADQANRVWTAAQTLWSMAGRSGVPQNVSITIRKNIPIAAGLGGGSSDAAAALRGLCWLWQLTPDPAWLRKIAGGIGSDVSFFLRGGIALAEGRGERLRRCASHEFEPFWVVLAVPRFGVSTAQAYRWLDADRSRHAAGRPRSFRKDSFANDLETVVARRHPELKVMVSKLMEAGATRAAMSGSGSAVFGLFPRQALALRARCAVRRPGWRTLLTRAIDRRVFEKSTAIQVVSRASGR